MYGLWYSRLPAAGCDEFWLPSANYFSIRRLRRITADTAIKFYAGNGINIKRANVSALRLE
jgi:hypothetical protein